MQVYRNFIGGEFVLSQGTRRLANTNPANSNDVLGEAILATKAEAATWLQTQALQGRQILIKGSRGMGLETLLELV